MVGMRQKVKIPFLGGKQRNPTAHPHGLVEARCIRPQTNMPRDGGRARAVRSYDNRTDRAGFALGFIRFEDEALPCLQTLTSPAKSGFLLFAATTQEI
jgi:hypothetical protein